MSAYLDNNATTPLRSEIADAMDRVNRELFGNPSSTHRAGQRARHLIEEARRRVALAFAWPQEGVVFTSSGTESVAAALGELVRRQPRRKHLLVSRTDHKAVLETAAALEKKGFEITRMAVDGDGLLAPGTLRSALQTETAVVSLTTINSETGVVWDVELLAKIAREHGAFVHLDAVQSPGRRPSGPWPADAVSLSPHKFHGPKGVGILLTSPEWSGPGLIPGSQERGRRGGTENVGGIAGAGLAAEGIATSLLPRADGVTAMRDRLEKRLSAIIPEVVVVGAGAPRAGNTLCIASPRVDGEALLLALSESGVYASAGSACASGSLEPSHVLLAMGLDPPLARGAVRFSLSTLNTEEDVDQAVEAVSRFVHRLESHGRSGP